MKFVTRKIDPLGRVVIPADIRDALSFQQGDEVCFEMVPGGVRIFKKPPKSCIICDSDKLLIDLGEEKKLCIPCSRQAAKALEEVGISIS